MFILTFLPIYLSIFFVVVFKILVISVSNMDDNPPSLFIDVHNPKDGVTWRANGIYLGQGENPVELPEEVHPGKINVKLMTYC